ncbi:MAG: hypothetical protein IKT32_02255 [Clostridia bacterium]|nr:hypothetical protein [Clostridia bacterium]
MPKDIKELRKAITSKGGFASLRGMTANERVDFFSKYVDMPGSTSTAEWLNREIERRILKPSQTAAVKDWVKKLEKKDVKISNKEALIDRVLKKKEIFNPRGFYADGLVKQALGFETSREDAKKLYDLSVSVNEYKKNLLALDPEYLNRNLSELADLPENVQKAREALGEKLVEFQKEYEAINLKAQLVDYANKNLSGKILERVLQVAGNIKSVKASFDVSFLRQLQTTALAGQKTSFLDAMKSGYKIFFGKEGWADTLMADLLSRPNALAGRYSQFGVEVGIKEEAFPESWVSQMIDKTGMINLFRRSEEAFNVSIQTARADLFDNMWENTKGDVKLLRDQDVGKVINQLTGRGSIPLLTPTDPKTQRIINNLLFAPKWLASRIQLLTDARFALMSGNKVTIDGKTVLTPQGLRAKAAIFNIILIAFVAAGRKYLWGDEFEQDTDIGTALDPRSSDFGKVIIGRTRFDLTAGTASLITLTARLATQESKTAKGKVRPMKSSDILFNFLSGKSSPGIQLATNIQHAIRTGGEFVDYRGKPLKWETGADWRENLADFFLPISLTSGIIESGAGLPAGIRGEQDSAYWGEVMGIVADFVGVGANTYEKK